MKFRAYGHVKDSKTADDITGAIIKIYLNEEELQKGKSVENGFYEVVVDIEDSRIESGQQLSVTVEKEGFEKQEHRLLATEGSFNLDIKLETAAAPPPKPFNWLPVIIAGGAVILLLIIGIVVLLLIKPKPPRITSFTADPNSIELGQTATLRWKTKNAKSVEILIDQNVVSLDSDGNRQVQPTQTTEYELIAKGKKGEKVTESQVVVVEDVAPPEVTITLSPSEPTSEEDVTFTASATDSGGISKIEILVNDTKVEECPDSPCTYKGGPYTLDSISYTVYVWDKSENKATVGPESIKIQDAGAPRVKITASPETPNTKDKVTFTARASDPGGIRKLQIFVNGKKVKECTDTRCSFGGGPYSLGKVSYEAYAWDKSGNKGVSGSKTIAIADIVAPRVTITASPKSPNTKDKITLTASASDPGGIRNVQIYVNKKKVKECTGSPCTYKGGPYPLGSVSYYANAYDKTGNRGSTVSRTIDIVDKIPPSVSIIHFPISPTAKQKVTFKATAKDPGGVSKVECFVKGGKTKECAGPTCSYIGGPYPTGIVTYWADAHDRAGNKASTGPKKVTIESAQGIAGYDLRSASDRVLTFDYNGDGNDDLFLYRPGRGAAWVAKSNRDGSFARVYAVGDNGSASPNGIAGYNLLSAADRVLVFDYDGDKDDDLFLYRPGRGAAWVARSNRDGTFTNVYAVGDNGSAQPNGIAGYDLLSSSDQVLTFDYDGDKDDDLFLYRPGRGAAWVARSNRDGTFTKVYAVGDNGTARPNGIAGYDLLSVSDRVLAFDYDGDKDDDLFLYRPGRGAAWVARSNRDGTFTKVYASTNGIAGYDLHSATDRVLAFDYDGDGDDDLFLYRPGRGAAWVARSNRNGTFTKVYAVGDNGTARPNGIAGYDLLSAADRVLAFDYDSDGDDDLFLYRPGGGAAWVARSNGDGTFKKVN